MIRIENVTVSLNGKTVLKNIMSTTPAEGVTLIAGESGVGKTTLLRVLAGLLVPDEGRVELPGHPVMLFQEDRLFPRRRVREQVEAVLPRTRWETVPGWLELVELEDAGEKLPEELSGGMARRAALARTLAVEGDILLLDEPFAGVDSMRAKRILERLRGLGKPILLTGHAPELEKWCDRVISL